jgi:hypothetical protein
VSSIQLYRRMNPFGIANALTKTIEAMEQPDQPSTPQELTMRFEHEVLSRVDI